VIAESLKSKLTSDGILTVEAPIPEEAIQEEETKIPIELNKEEASSISA